jgi:short-subunit dehydrogenase
MLDPRVILITGASGGIGAALARAYAAPGRTLLLLGRDGPRLAAAAEAARANGAEARCAAIDVTDAPALGAWIAEADRATPIDLAIANAGISGGTGGGSAGEAGRESEAQARRIFAVNLDGVLNTLFPLARPMRARGRGQLAIMSSLAAFRGFPGAPAYSASKAAVRVWGEALRGELAPAGISVSVICPGFIRSAMTGVNDYPMPFLMDADRAARIIRRGLARGRPRIAFPFPLYFAAWLGGTLPPALVDPLLSRLPRKPAAKDR